MLKVSSRRLQNEQKEKEVPAPLPNLNETYIPHREEDVGAGGRRRTRMEQHVKRRIDMLE